MASGVDRKIGIVAGVVIVAAIVIAAVSSSWTAQQRDPNAPEGVVQRYIAAVLDHRSDDAVALLASDTTCTAEHVDTTYFGDDPRVDLVSVTVTGDRARVVVHVEYANGDPFGGSYGEDHTLRLVRETGAWRITGVPWPLYSCGIPVKS